MKIRFKYLAVITAIGMWVNAVLFLLFPAFSMSLLGRELNAAGLMNTRLSGAIAFSLALVLYLLRDLPASREQRWLKICMLLQFLLVLLIDLHGLLTGAINQVGWVIFVADALLASAWFLTIIHRYD